MFAVRYLNGDVIDTAKSVSSVLGDVVHKALQAYLGGEENIPTPADEGEAIKHGYERGKWHLDQYADGFIHYSSTIKDRQTLEEKYSFVYFEYIKDYNYQKRAKETLIIEKKLKHKVDVNGQELPIPLVCYNDVVYRDFKGRVCIDDHKITGKYSDEDKIDGAKLIQAAVSYFTVEKELGEKPYQITFRECKSSKNSDGTPQTREYTIVYEDVPLLFEFFFRLYQDVTDSLLGKVVYLPNLSAMFDNEVSLLAYIYRLDNADERDKAFKRMKVENITEFLKKKIQKDGSMKKYLETVTKQFISAKTLNYKTMKTEDRIKMKLAEHGIALDFDSKVLGYNVTLYRFEPSIGIKMSRIDGYVKDIEQVVGVSGIRILAPIPNSSLVGFEVPNEKRTFPEEKSRRDGFNLAMGVDITGKVVRLDIREAPHLLVAGTTGSGKSVFLNSLISQIKNIPNSALMLFDPKMVELAQYKKDAVVYSSDSRIILEHTNSLIQKMNRRYSEMQKMGIKNINEANDLDYIFVVIDEYGDLRASTFGKQIRENLLILAQKARACGIHIILATQRPSVKVIDGDIKANFNCRVCFRVATQVDSQVVLDEKGAEKLLGKGDLLLKTNDGITRLQGYKN